ncbi:hypothetical protein BH09MYX1_BH09MYX1_58170 [soil metagenome]
MIRILAKSGHRTVRADISAGSDTKDPRGVRADPERRLVIERFPREQDQQVGTVARIDRGLHRRMRGAEGCEVIWLHAGGRYHESRWSHCGTRSARTSSCESLSSVILPVQPMSTADDLYRAVLAQPAHDGPRRTYATYLETSGDELGEYIRLSIEVDHRRPANTTRQLELHNKLQQRLTAPIASWIRSHVPDRGLVALVQMDGKTFVDHGADVFAKAPLQHLDLVETKAVFAQVVNNPVLAKVQTLTLDRSDLGDAEAELLAASPNVRQLVYLSLFGNHIGQPGLEAIAASNNLPELRVFDFGYNAVESPVGTTVSDGVSGLEFYQPGGPLAAALRKKFGEKVWLELPPNISRYRMCDAGE